MKFHFSLAVLCTVLFFCSCQKEDLRSSLNTPNNTQASAQASASQQLSASQYPAGLKYGALIDAPTAKGCIDFQLNVAAKLGISCLRTRTLVPSTTPSPLLNSGYKVLLNFICQNFTGTARPFVTDLTKYKADLVSTLKNYVVMPEVAVIENEESNKSYYSSGPEAYINQLNTAIEVMHSYGIKVANGGITDVGLNYLVYQDLLAQGKADSALLFKNLTKVAPKYAPTQERGAYVNTLLEAYTHMDLDYVNFHWKGKSPDTLALSMVIDYLQKRTGKKVINNELGQYDTDPNTLLTHMQACANKNLSYVVWYSPDKSEKKPEIPLHNSDQSLTPSGVAYQGYLGQ